MQFTFNSDFSAECLHLCLRHVQPQTFPFNRKVETLVQPEYVFAIPLQIDALPVVGECQRYFMSGFEGPDNQLRFSSLAPVLNGIAY